MFFPFFWIMVICDKGYFLDNIVSIVLRYKGGQGYMTPGVMLHMCFFFSIHLETNSRYKIVK